MSASDPIYLSDPQITNEDIGQAVRFLSMNNNLDQVWRTAAVYAAARQSMNNREVQDEKYATRNSNPTGIVGS